MSPTDLGARSLDLTDPAAFVDNDVHAYWRDVRARNPVHWHEPTDRNPGFWVVSRYADVQPLYTDAALGSARGNVLDVVLRGDDSAGGSMVAVTDAPRHRPLRNLLFSAFTPRVLGEVVEEVGRRTTELVSSVVGRGTFDFAAEIADRIPMNTICDLLSIPAADREELLGWNKRALSSVDAGYDELDAIAARNEIVLYFMDLAQERRDRPGDDVISLIAAAEVEGRPLTVEELAVNCYSLILGGDETSRVSAISGVLALIGHPGQWRALRTGEVSVESAVEEVLRWSTPSFHVARTALRDLEIGGNAVRAGDIVTLWTVSANNDETVFDAPRRFTLSRSPNKHLSFGHGPHYCLGAYLARAELRMLLTALVEQVGRMELCGTPRPIYSNFLNGYDDLPVRFEGI
ncbi:cytochrome [Streptomyces sp. TSRI0445]|uniref:cytochrome P450 n=1 Tax=Streptomyces TaxID=1883 RepID=UPI00093C289C|nr:MULTISPECIES: cytochrome P450 [unclassified Streptomyces]OKI70319.1 cytochrome [Streptomyces sp. TSRI0445]RDL03152.1 cytochrome P450 [Streptomyces sp. HB202]UIZ12719.1 cytochrome P450 [Streptomyces sp. R527F]WSU83751.1 cytochrome P450 [Streptomyces globisporus]